MSYTCFVCFETMVTTIFLHGYLYRLYRSCGVLPIVCPCNNVIHVIAQLICNNYVVFLLDVAQHICRFTHPSHFFIFLPTFAILLIHRFLSAPPPPIHHLWGRTARVCVTSQRGRAVVAHCCQCVVSVWTTYIATLRYRHSPCRQNLVYSKWDHHFSEDPHRRPELLNGLFTV